MLNELRVQYARRHQFRTSGHLGGRPGDHRQRHRRSSAARASATAIRSASTSTRASGRSIDNLTLAARPARASRRASTRSSSPTIASAASTFMYTFPTNAAYLAAKSGANPLGYTTPAADVRQRCGRATTRGFYGFFVQDDWQITPQHEAALRRALRPLRRAVGAPVRGEPVLAGLHHRQEQLRSARRRVSWSVDSAARTVVRASTGMMYEPPLLDFYDNSILNNGDPASYNGLRSGHRRRARRRSRPAWRTCRRDSCCRARASRRSIRTSRRSRRG